MSKIAKYGQYYDAIILQEFPTDIQDCCNFALSMAIKLQTNLTVDNIKLFKRLFDYLLSQYELNLEKD